MNFKKQQCDYDCFKGEGHVILFLRAPYNLCWGRALGDTDNIVGARVHQPPISGYVPLVNGLFNKNTSG